MTHLHNMVGHLNYNDHHKHHSRKTNWNGRNGSSHVKETINNVEKNNWIRMQQWSINRAWITPISPQPSPEHAMQSSSHKALFKQMMLIELPLDVKYKMCGIIFKYLQGDIFSLMTIDDWHHAWLPLFVCLVLSNYKVTR